MTGALVVGGIALVGLVVMWLMAGRPRGGSASGVPVGSDPLGRSGPYTDHELGKDAYEWREEDERGDA